MSRTVKMLTIFVKIWLYMTTGFRGANGAPPAGICSHSSTDRGCWGKFDLQTNYYDEIPETGVTREYWFNLVNTTAAPDGVERTVLTINGSIPGPTIFADWGDTVIVHLTNSVTNNGTGIHFHGIRQNLTNYMDGVPSVTQCPIAPGDTFTYIWRASQYGTSWYHSHFAVQAWDGVFGGMIINGPATANYEEDKGVIMFNDWSNTRTAFVLAQESQRQGPPLMENSLINGTNVFNSTGSRFETRLKAGTSYRFRFVNAAADAHYRISIDNHSMTVISTDFVAIKPYNTTNISIGMGQRYDVIIYTDKETTGSFWLRATPQLDCSNHANVENVRGIIHYGDSNLEPTSIPQTTIDSCFDESMSNIVPELSLPASANYSIISQHEATLQNIEANKILWAMNNSSFVSRWDYPSIKQVYEGNDTWTRSQNVVKLPEADRWAYFVITTNFNASHPIHFHGHDFWVLAAGQGTYNQNNVTLQLRDAPRRDVAILPKLGYLVLAIITDNPGAWLIHCHIAWHASEGFALQLLEREDEMRKIPTIYNQPEIESVCEKWELYSSQLRLRQDDSGI